MNWLLTPLSSILVLMLILILVWEKLFEHVTVYEYETGFKYYNGKHIETLKSGRYHLRRGHSEVRKLDLRPQFLTLPGQEILTADRIQLKISLVLQFEIQDPLKALHGVDNYQNALYLRLQLLLRESVQSYTLESLLADQAGLLAQLQAKGQPALAELGLNLKTLSVKDIMLPGDLKRAYTQVLKVQKEAQAALEKARGEQASLRSLANAARMFDKNPSLLQLRLIQTLENGQTRPTIVFQPSSTTGYSASTDLPPDSAES